MKLYLSGPMSSKPENNFPEFKRAASILRQRGFEVVSPAELDKELGPKQGVSYGHYLGRDVQLLIDECQGIVLLPEWTQSKGARIEATTAIIVGKQVFFELNGHLLHTASRNDIRQALNHALLMDTASRSDIRETLNLALLTDTQ